MPDYLSYTKKKRRNTRKKTNNKKRTNKKLLKGGYWFYPSKKTKKIINFKKKIIDYLTLLERYNNCKIEKCEELKLIFGNIKIMKEENQNLTYQYKTYKGIENISYETFIDGLITYNKKYELYLLKDGWFSSKYKIILVDEPDYKVISNSKWLNLVKSFSKTTYGEYMKKVDEEEEIKGQKKQEQEEEKIDGEGQAEIEGQEDKDEGQEDEEGQAEIDRQAEIDIDRQAEIEGQEEQEEKKKIEERIKQILKSCNI